MATTTTAAPVTANVMEAGGLLGEAQALLEGKGHLFLAHPEAGYERVVPVALDPARGLQVQAAGPADDKEEEGETRWVAWTELKALAERR